MVAIVFSRYLPPKGGQVGSTSFVDFSFLSPPPPYIFSECGNTSLSPYECVRLLLWFHTLCVMIAYTHCVYHPESGGTTFPSA